MSKLGVIAKAMEVFTKKSGQTQFVMSAGLCEDKSPTAERFSLLQANRNIAEKMKSLGFSDHYHYSEFNGNHNCYCWQETLASTLTRSFGLAKEAKLSATPAPRCGPSI